MSFTPRTKQASIKTLRKAASLGLTAGAMALLLSLNGSIAFADEPKPANAAEAKVMVEKLEQEQKKLEDNAVGAIDRAEKLRSSLKEKETTIAAQERRLEEARAQLSSLVLADYQAQPQGVTQQFLFSEDPSEVIARLVTVEQTAKVAAEQLHEFEIEQSALKEAKRTMDADLSSLKQTETDADRLKEEIDAKVKSARRVYENLSTEEKQRFDSERRQKEEFAKQTSRDAEREIPHIDPGNASERAMAAVNFALAQMGKSYVMGATGPNAYDCSGLTMSSWRAAGVSIPRTAGSQWSAGRVVSASEALPGDLVIYHGGGHVEMYIGNGKVVGAVNPSMGILIRGMYDESGFNAVVRVVG